MMLKLLILIFTILAQEAHGCHPALKHFDEEEVILCSSMLSTEITWLFNNQSEVGPGVVVSQEGRSIVIPASDKSVYGDYSCFQNNRFVNCSSLYISGECNITCAGLTTDIENIASTFLIGSTITLYLTVKINLSPTDSQGGFILYKDEKVLHRENVTYDRESFTYHLFNAQLADRGVYYAEHISENAMLFTNRLFINVTNVTNHIPSITLQNLTRTSTTTEITPTATVHVNTTEYDEQAPTATANGKSESNNTVGIAVGVSVAAVLVIGLVGVLLMVIGIIKYRNRKTTDNNSSNNIQESTSRSIHMQETGYYMESESPHAQYVTAVQDTHLHG